MEVVDINSIQDEIISEFGVLGDDKESSVLYIMELGNKLEPLEERYKIDENLIRGCQSKVWLNAELQGDRLVFKADSNTEITKGLISLLIRVLSGKRISDILNSNLYFLDRIGISNIVGSQRSNGLMSMIKQIKLYALAYKTKMNGNSKK
ncbi:MAG TPA: SufE family protein [Cyclobacteriaceae bacterium]|nr:SufE family protein [Cyclobacteriaceae bacterium]